MMGDMAVDCGCCDFVCIISLGDLDGDECTGVWDRDVGGFSNPNHSTEDDDALWRDTTAADGYFPWQVFTRANFELTDLDPAEPDTLYAGHWEVFVAGGVAGCSSYVFARTTQERPLTGNSYQKFELGIVLAGVTTILAQHVHDDNVAACIEATDTSGPDDFLDECYGFYEADGSTVQGGLENGVELSICFDGETVSATFPTDCVEGLGTLKLVLAAHQVPGVGTLADILETARFAGFGTSTISDEVTEVIFTDYEFARSSMDDSDGNPCGDCTKHCCGSPVPREILIEIGGTFSGTIDTCDCDVVLGSYVVTSGYPTITSGTGGVSVDLDCYGDAWCLWRGDFEIVGCDLNIIRIVLTSAIVSGSRVVSLIVLYSAAVCTLLTATVTTSLACDEWDDWVNMTVNIGGGGCGDCDETGVTVRFKLNP